MNELKVVAVKMDQALHFPADGSTSYTVFKKTGDNTWESCGEFIENREDALLYAAAPELLEVVREIVDHATKYGAAPLSAEKMFDRARAAIAKARGTL